MDAPQEHLRSPAARLGPGRLSNVDPALAHLSTSREFKPSREKPSPSLLDDPPSATWAGAAQLALDAMDIGVIVCGADGRLLFANLAARERLDRRADLMVRPRSRRLVTTCPRRAAEFDGVVAKAAAGVGQGALLLSDSQGDRTLVVVRPAPVGLSGTGTALVLTRSTGASQPAAAASQIQNLFGLTRSEATVAHGLLAGASLSELMETRGVTENTLRSQLSSIFRKAEVTGQRELVRILSLIPPLR